MSAFFGRTGCSCTYTWCDCYSITGNCSSTWVRVDNFTAAANWEWVREDDRPILRYPAQWLGERRTAIEGLRPQWRRYAGKVWRLLAHIGAKQRRQQKRRRFLQRLAA